MSAGHVLFNGVDGRTGNYLRSRMSFDEIAPRLARKLRKRRLVHRALAAGRDPCDLSQAGWGVIFGPSVDRCVKEALGRLRRHRSAMASRREPLYKEYVYRTGDTKASFLRAHGGAPGAVNPRKIPYYLLIVGDPQEVPFRFQCQLDVQHAVGRLWLRSPEEYAVYADTVVDLETNPVDRPREAVFFGPWRDEATRLSADRLVRPLADELACNLHGWKVRHCLGDYANKWRLSRLLGGEETPSLLFTAGHGLGFWDTDPLQRDLQGALVCQEWPGPGEISTDHFFSADDVADTACVRGLVSFHFACFSAGTPKWDNFAHIDTGKQARAAPEEFVAHLPQRLLGHPRGSALAVIGHVDQAWQHSFVWERRGPHVETFQSALLRMMQGDPVGAAMEYFSGRYAEIATEITDDLEGVSEEEIGDRDLAMLWLAHNDARNYIVLGDPAVRIPGRAAAAPNLTGSAVPPVWRGV